MLEEEGGLLAGEVKIQCPQWLVEVEGLWVVVEQVKVRMMTLTFKLLAAHCRLTGRKHVVSKCVMMMVVPIRAGPPTPCPKNAPLSVFLYLPFYLFLCRDYS